MSTETIQKQSFHDYLISSVKKTNGKAAFLNFLDYKQTEILESEIDNNWMFRFSDYLKERNYAANSRSKYIKTLFTIIKRARSRGFELPVELDVIKNEVFVQTEASESVYLTRDELKLIEQYTPKRSGEKFTRAIFLICAYTGCRISDAQILSSNNFQVGQINYTSEKTKATSRLPLHPLVPELVESIKGAIYDEDSIRVIVSRDIKNICKKVGIDSVVTLYRRGVRETKPKWAVISSHTARKSFATNMLLDGYSIEQISKILGHGKGKGDTSTTMSYICTSFDDIITGNRTYLRPNADDLYDKLKEIMSIDGITIEQACSILLMSGANATEVERVKTKYNNQKK